MQLQRLSEAFVGTRQAPGPRGAPIVGSLFDIRPDPLGFFERVAREHGDVVQVRVGLENIWMLSHPRDIEQVLVGYKDDLIKDPITRSLRTVLGDGLLTAEGETWKKHRKLFAPSFQPRHLAAYGQSMTDATRRHLPPVGEQDIHETMTALTMDIVLRTLFGVAPRTGEPEARSVGPLLTGLMENFERHYRSLWRLVPDGFPSPFLWRAQRLTAELHAVVLERVAARRLGEPGDDLLWRLLEARDEDGNGMDDVQIRDEAVTLFLAGHETTALALSYALWQLAAHPDWQAAIRSEVDALGHDPGSEDVGKLPVTTAVVRETLRLYPPAWGFGREALAPLKIHGYTIPKGARVTIFPWVVHRDPRFYVNPLAFDPDRWLKPDPNLPKTAYLPFGAGPRICVGNHFAMMEAVLVLATLLQHRGVAPVPGFSPTFVPAVTLRTRHGVSVRVTNPS